MTATSAVAAWRAWHEELEADRTAPHGSLAATALHWLDETPTRLDDLPGVWRLDGGVPVVELDDGDALILDDDPRTGTVHFDGIPLDNSVLARWGEVAIEVGERAGELLVRPRRPDAAARAGYPGTETFDYDPAYVVTAAFEPSPGAEIETGSVIDKLRHQIRVAGIARFEIGGTAVTATVFHHKNGEDYRVLFRDQTGGELTYPASRNLIIDPASGSHDGELVLDFNRTWNLPCAYAPFWTCALPPPENTFPVRIEAGELRPRQAT